MIAVPFGGSIFPSKRDFWIVALIWLGAGMAIFGGFAQFSSDASVWLQMLILVALVALAGLMLWILYGTRYSFTEDSLLVVSGPFRFRVPLSEIEGCGRRESLCRAPRVHSTDYSLSGEVGGEESLFLRRRSQTSFLSSVSDVLD
jgi:hypothetical protein